MTNLTAHDAHRIFTSDNCIPGLPQPYDTRDVAGLVAVHDAGRFVNSYSAAGEYELQLSVAAREVDDDVTNAIDSLDWAFDCYEVV